MKFWRKNFNCSDTCGFWLKNNHKRHYIFQLNCKRTRYFDKAKLQENVNDQRALKAMYQIGKNLDKTFSIDEMAEEAHLGKYRFIRLFKQQTGYTPVEYIIRQRILHAQMLFIDGTHTLKEVASMIGYNNLTYFTRSFKIITELTPSEFIRQNK